MDERKTLRFNARHRNREGAAFFYGIFASLCLCGEVSLHMHPPYIEQQSGPLARRANMLTRRLLAAAFNNSEEFSRS